MEAPLLYLGLAVVATGVIWAGSGLLERSAERLSKHNGLPVAVHGAVVVAVEIELSRTELRRREHARPRRVFAGRRHHLQPAGHLGAVAFASED